jgi:hypothetical protein
MAFRLKCVAKLYNELGRYDAVVEFTELSVRSFISEANTTGDFNRFIAAKSAEHGIVVNSVPEDIFRARISQSYILSVYQTAEGFFHEFKTELEELEGEPIKLEESKSDYFTKLVNYVAKTNQKKSQIGLYRLSLFNYYRIVRNKYSHDFIADEHVKDAFDKLNPHLASISADYMQLNAPNSFEEIGFDDFILFSRLVKDIADKINELIVPENDNMLLNYYRKKDLYKKYPDHSARKNNALKAHINDNFGLDNDEAQLIVEQLSH